MALTKVTGSVIKDSVSLSGNVSVGGTLTYQDVTNVDALGIGTFRTGIKVLAGQVDVGSNIKLGNAGVITATSFSGVMSGTTGSFSGQINLDNVSIAGVTTFSEDTKFIGAISGRDLQWDKSDNALEFLDYTSAFFGTDNNLQIYHNAGNNNTYISENGVGSLLIQASDLYLNNSAGQNYITCATGGRVQLNFNGNNKLQTTNTGVTVTGTVAATSYTGDGSNLTGITGTTINNNADNRVITGSGTANTLEGEANLTFDGAHLELGYGKGVRTNFIRPAANSTTNTAGNSQQYWKIGNISLNGSEGAVITLMGANGYSAGSTQYAGETTIVLRGSNGNTLLGFWYSDSGASIATYADVRWKHVSGVNYELWVSAGSYNNIAPIVKTTGTFDTTNAAATGSNTAPSGSTALPSNHCKQVGTIQTIEYQSTGTIFKRNIVMSSGYGIDFSATSDYTGAGSGTPSELLDEYEEGTFTPRFQTSNGNWGGSMNSQAGSYTRIGNFVHVRFRIHWGSVSGSGTFRVTSLPFTVANTGSNEGGGATIGWRSGFNYPRLTSFFRLNTQLLQFGYVDGSAPFGSFDLSVGAIASTGYAYCSGSYEVA